ncbi:MAG: TraR/DksA family transcriptional regulator [Methylococcaceae bacterium]
MEEYEQVRRNLIVMLEELDERLSKIGDDVKHVDEYLEQDSEERATQMENDEVLDQLGNATRTEIEEVKQAIARIDKGDYGLCMVCGEPISAGRLQAIPYVGMCIKCASLSGC